MLRQNKVISIITILGTAFAIMMVMSIVLVDRLQNVSAAPEVNRDKILYIPSQQEENLEKQNCSSSQISFETADQYLLKMQTPKLVTLVNTYNSDRPWTVNRQGSKDLHDAILRMTNHSYWDIMSFDFLDGRPFDQNEDASGIRVAVISQTMARKLFGDQKAVGSTINIRFAPFRVVGVVKDVSPIFREAYGDIWVPVTSHSEFTDQEFIVMLMPGEQHTPAEIEEEIREIEKQYNTVNKPWQVTFAGPVSHQAFADETYSFDTDDTHWQILMQSLKTLLIVLLLLIVPAVNLIGFSLSRIQKRMPEIGVRKAFGAKKRTILTQVLYENMLTSLIGGFIGLILSFITVYWLRYWLLDIPPGSTLPGNAMLDWFTFLTVFVLSVLLNLFSAGIPAYRASRLEIVDALYQNDKKA